MKAPINAAWSNMKYRCDNPSCIQYVDYGGRGITYPKDWRFFWNFERDMKSSWFPGSTLERRRNNEGYSKDNCYWATPTEQNRNKRGVIFSPEKVEEAKRLYAEGWSQERIAKLFGCVQANIHYIVTSKTWV